MFFYHNEEHHFDNRGSHSSSSSFSSYSSRSSYYSYRDPGTNSFSHFLTTQLLNMIWILLGYIFLWFLFPNNIFSILMITFPFILAIKLAMYFICWASDDNQDSFIKCCQISSIILFFIYLIFIYGYYSEVLSIDQQKARHCQILTGEQINIGGETYTALNVQMTLKDGTTTTNGYGCISDHKYNSGMTKQQFVDDFSFCLINKDQNNYDQKISKTINFNSYIQQNDEEEQQQYDPYQLLEIEEQQEYLDENSEQKILRVGGGRGGGSRSSYSGGSRSGSYRGSSYRGSSYRGSSYRGSRYNYSGSHYRYRSSSYQYGYSSSTTIIWYDGGYHYGYSGMQNTDFANHKSCDKKVMFATTKIPPWLCKDQRDLGQLRYENECYYSYHKTSLKQNYIVEGQQKTEPRFQNSFYLVTFDKHIYYQKFMFFMLLIAMVCPCMICACQSCFIEKAFDYEKYLIKFVKEQEKVYHERRHARHRNNNNNNNQNINNNNNQQQNVINPLNEEQQQQQQFEMQNINNNNNNPPVNPMLD